MDIITSVYYGSKVLSEKQVPVLGTRDGELQGLFYGLLAEGLRELLASNLIP